MQSFPARLAAIDIGSNAIRMLAAEFLNAGTWKPLDEVRLPVRLGHDVFQTGELTSATLGAAIKGLQEFNRRIHTLSVERCRAVATSAVRDSRNGFELVQRARDDAGIIINVISGAEEARLVHLAVRNRIPLGTGRWMLADLGGGSLEVSLIDHDHVLFTETYPVGSVRLLERLGGAYQPQDVRDLIAEFASSLRNSPTTDVQPGRFIATGGNIEAIARLARLKPDEGGTYRLDVLHLRQITQDLARLTYQQRVDQLGLRRDRADVIVPAAIVYEWVAGLIGADSILVPAVGVKEGVLWDMLHLG